MAFTIDMPAAARRHLHAADILMTDRLDVAGYIYGLAAECAVKAMMRDAGLYPSSAASKREDPFYAHFPGLRTMVRDNLTGRRGAVLLKYIEDDSFMNHWSIEIRYCASGEVKSQWVAVWADQARQIVSSIGT